MVIEKGVPIPRPYRARTETSRLVGEMQPGDSLLVDTEDAGRNVKYMGKYRGFKMTMRKMEGGWRVWRVE